MYILRDAARLAGHTHKKKTAVNAARCRFGHSCYRFVSSALVYKFLTI
jgi:hypothetical protein